MTSGGIEPDGIDIQGARVYAIPMTTRFRGITIREGMLIEGPAGWGEFCPFREYDDREAASRLATAIEAATVGWPAPIRDRVQINCTVPAVGPQCAYEIVSASGCSTAKVKVADHPDSLVKTLPASRRPAVPSARTATSGWMPTGSGTPTPPSR